MTDAPNVSSTPMRKVVINARFGEFSLSREAEEAYLARKGKSAYFYVNARGADGRINFDSYKRADDATERYFVTYTVTEDLGDTPTKEQFDAAYNRDSGCRFYDRDVPRDDPDLVAVVEDLGRGADGQHASLEIVEIPADVEWEIAEYDGSEHIAEAHRVWR